jgi:hypothetical protein
MATASEAGTVPSESEPIGGASSHEAVTPVQGSLRDYEELVAKLESMSDGELRELAHENGIDAADSTPRAELIAKLSDQPGANEH